MPLTRDTTTSGLRFLLPIMAAHAAFYGGLYLTDPDGRLQRNPGLAFARLIMPMPFWGIVLLVAAALMMAALLTHNRSLMVGALYGYAAVNVCWAAIYGCAPLVSPDASYGGPGHVLLIAATCVAAAMTLQHREVQ